MVVCSSHQVSHKNSGRELRDRQTLTCSSEVTEASLGRSSGASVAIIQSLSVLGRSVEEGWLKGAGDVVVTERGVEVRWYYDVGKMLLLLD